MIIINLLKLFINLMIIIIPLFLNYYYNNKILYKINKNYFILKIFCLNNKIFVSKLNFM